MKSQKTTQPEKGQVSALGEIPKDKEQKPTTGIPQLDNLIDEASYESQAMAYTCLDLCQRNASMGDKITSMLDSLLRGFREGDIPGGADFECDVAPATKWLRFADGFEAGSIIGRNLAEQPETQEQPAEKSTELCIDQQTQEKIKSYYKSLDPKTKLAITTLSEIQCLEGINFQISKKEGKLFNQIFDDLENVCLETFHRKPDDDAEDIWLAGVWEACRMVLQNT